MTIDVDSLTWEEHQEWERQWWGNCENTFAEENKQIVYANRMGLVNESPPTLPDQWPAYNLQGKNVLDVGGGPSSMLLKCYNKGPICFVADPCEYPSWVEARYNASGIDYAKDPGEEIGEYHHFDEAWIYNVLQHTRDPEAIAKNMLRIATTVRVFEWVDTEKTIGHPHVLTAKLLDDWFEGHGTVELLNTNGCVGPAWYGVFDGRS